MLPNRDAAGSVRDRARGNRGPAARPTVARLSGFQIALSGASLAAALHLLLADEQGLRQPVGHVGDADTHRTSIPSRPGPARPGRSPARPPGVAERADSGHGQPSGMGGEWSAVCGRPSP